MKNTPSISGINNIYSFLFLFLFILFSENIYSQAESDSDLKDTILVKKLVAEIDTLIRGKKFDSASQKCEEAKNILSNISFKYSIYYIQILYREGNILNSKSMYVDAIEKYKLAIKSGMEFLDRHHILLGNAKYSLAGCYFRISDFQNALLIAEEALDIFIKNENERMEATTYIILGLINKSRSDIKQSIFHNEKALNIFKKDYGNNYLNIAYCLNNLGIIYFEQGELDKSLEKMNGSLDIKIKVLGEDNPLVGSTYNSICLIYLNKGDIVSALKYSNKALEIQTKSPESRNLDLALTYNNKGLIYYNLGDLEKGKDYQIQALDILKRMFGERHSEIAKIYNNLGVYSVRSIQDYSFTRDYLSKSLEIWNSFGNLYEISRVQNNLAEYYLSINNIDSAIYFAQKGLETRRTIDNNHPNIALSLLNLGKIYAAKQDFKKAIDSINEAILLLKQGNRETSYILPELYYQIAKIYISDLNKLEEGIEYLIKSIDSIDKGYSFSTIKIYSLIELGIAFYRLANKGNDSRSLDKSMEFLLSAERAINNTQKSMILSNEFKKSLSIARLRL